MFSLINLKTGHIRQFDTMNSALEKAERRGLKNYQWFAAAEPQQSNLTGEAHIALVPNQGWTLFGADGSPIARFADEDSAKKALAELPPVPTPAEIAA